MYKTGKDVARKELVITSLRRSDRHQHARSYITKHGICYVCKTGVYDGNIKINTPIPCIKRSSGYPEFTLKFSSFVDALSTSIFYKVMKCLFNMYSRRYCIRLYLGWKLFFPRMCVTMYVYTFPYVTLEQPVHVYVYVCVNMLESRQNLPHLNFRLNCCL